MAIAAPVFYDDVQTWIQIVIVLFALIIEIIAFLNCLMQRQEAFAAIGTLPKGGWLALTGGSALFTVLAGWRLGLLGFIAITIAAVYMLGIRPALRDAVDGQGNW